MTQQEQSRAGPLLRLLDDVSGLPRRNALDLLCKANRALIELIGPDAASAALDDLVMLEP
jgi:hypothetical protein